MVFAGGSVRLGKLLWSKFDILIIDKSLVNGSAKNSQCLFFFLLGRSKQDIYMIMRLR